MVNSARLVDYFVVAGYDHENHGRRAERSGFTCQGRVIQRFPAKDWPDTPFIDGLEHFCQPNGWVLRPEKVEPKFFVSVLTDIEGRRHYCACLSFSEAVPKDLIEAAADREAADEEVEDVGDDLADGVVGQPSLVSGRRLASLGRTVRSGSLPRHVVPGISLPANAHDTILFAPKCLVIVTVHDFPEVFRNCLGVIYTVYSECLVGAGGERIRLETLIGNLLSSVYVPDEGGGPVRFSLGASDKLLLHPPFYPTIPYTGVRVALLFQQLGIHNVLCLLIAALTEHKLLFHSQSFSRLTDSCTALVALLYPMRYSHVFIPILPSSLIEVLSTPTPFIIGVHSLHAHELSGELLDVIYVDLDGGAIHLPDNLKVHTINEALLAKTQHELSLVFKPDLGTADNAFPDSTADTAGRKPQTFLDKELRAVILRLMVRILEGYRSCLTIVRIHPTPYITFHKAAFLGMRNQCDSDFIKRLVNCMFFNTLVSDRGPPWRQCDIFDELYSVFGEQCQVEQTDSSRVLRHIQSLAEELYRNENPVSTANQPYIQKIPQPAEGAITRVHQPVFPHLDVDLVQDVIQIGLDKRQLEIRSSSKQTSLSQRLVPMGLQLSSNMTSENPNAVLPNSARRLEVLRNCITSIFENKISDAKKTFPAVIGALKTRQARIALCDELALHKSGNQVMLDHQQFDMIVRLMNAALQDDSDMDEFGIAATLLPLSTVFGRKLAKGVVQFAYTLIQDHAVWQNQQFWEASFFNDVQTGIKAVYLAMQDQNSNNRSLSTSESPNFASHHSNRSQRHSNSEMIPNTIKVKESRKSTVCSPGEKSVLELAAEEMRRWTTLTEEVKKDLIMAEEKTVYSQAFDYTNRMINLLCPLELSPRRTGGRRIDEYENASNSISNSVAESDSIDAESGFEDQEIPDAGQHVIKFVLRFADKVCNESHVTSDHIKAVNQMIPGAVAMHMEMLEAVATEAKRLPPIQKPKIHLPSLLPGEDLITEHGLRVYLLPDGREEITGIGGGSSSTGGGIPNQSLALLPAEGALFLTNYRIIFKGNPIDPFAAEHTVTRYFPVSSLTKEKKVTVNEYLTEIEQQLRDGIQLRSNTFQLIRAAFDDEVSVEEVDNLRKNIHRIRYPENLYHFFAFRGNHSSQEPSSRGKEKQKYNTIRGFASKTLKNVSRAAGIKSKPRKSSKYLLPNMMPGHGRLSIPDMTNHESRIREEDEDSQAGDIQSQPSTPGLALSSPSNSVNANNTKSLERLSQRSYFKDWIRLGLINSDYVLSLAGSKTHQPNESFRVTTVNYRYSAVASYPALLLVPANGKVTDEFLKRYCRFHRQSRFPSITWKHPITQGLLLRGSTFHGRGVMGMIRRHQDGGSQGAGGQTENATSVEAEIYLTSVVQATPRAMIRPDSAWNMNGSELSLDTLVMPGPNSGEYPSSHLYPTLTPNMARKFNPITRAVDTLTRNTPVPSKMPRMSLSNLKTQRQMGSQSSISPGGMGTPSSRTSYRQNDLDSASDSGGMNSFLQRTALYIFGDKSQIRGIKLDAHPKAELIPVEFPDYRQTRNSFKKLMRACVPSTFSSQAEQTFLKLVESSEWLNHVGTLIQLSGAAVDLLDSQGASVMLCLEDGMDVTAQISSLAQLCLDPYYRTLEGFKTLIEKEWLAFGHKFNHHSNLNSENQERAFTPIFLQFLDAVHQIQSQFPAAFEFNQYYLKFLAYHHVSCRFRTFLCDHEQMYVTAGFLSNDKRQGTRLRDRASVLAGSVGNLGSSLDHSSDEETKTATLPQGPTHLGIHIFDYIDRQAAKSPIFHNFLYSVDPKDPVLRPSHQVSTLVIWNYYLGEELKHGPSYDIEIVGLDIEQEEEYNSASSGETLAGRGCLTAGYDCMVRTDLDVFSSHLRDIGILESALGHLPHRWQYHWNKLEIPPPLPPREPPVTLVHTTPSMYERRHGRMLHKRSTMDLLWKAKMGGSSGLAITSTDVSFATSHRFEKYNYTAPTSCEFCNGLVWGPRTGVRCVDCGYNCHEKCRDHASKTCAAKYKGVTRDPTSENLEKLTKNYDNNIGEPHPTDVYRFRPSGDENSQIIHQGYLYKQANFRIKGWKQRWFVLDSTKHQLRYYDTREDFQCRGHIDLSEVQRVSESLSAPGAPKKSEERCFFELQTAKRNYVLCADSRPAAQDWIAKIQMCLQ